MAGGRDVSVFSVSLPGGGESAAGANAGAVWSHKLTVTAWQDPHRMCIFHTWTYSMCFCVHGSQGAVYTTHSVPRCVLTCVSGENGACSWCRRYFFQTVLVANEQITVPSSLHSLRSPVCVDSCLSSLHMSHILLLNLQMDRRFIQKGSIHGLFPI